VGECKQVRIRNNRIHLSQIVEHLRLWGGLGAGDGGFSVRYRRTPYLVGEHGAAVLSQLLEHYRAGGCIDIEADGEDGVNQPTVRERSTPLLRVHVPEVYQDGTVTCGVWAKAVSRTSFIWL